MKTIEDHYGLGLFKFPFYEKYSFGHTGGIDGFSSVASYFPEEHLAISINSNGSSISLNDVMLGALNIYFEKEYELPVYKKAIQVELAILKQYEGTYESEDFPLDIKIFIEDDVLKAQATGQPSFPLTATSNKNFEFTPVNLQIEFIPTANAMQLTQRGKSFRLKKR